jgi:predicted dehydrogenase
LYKALVIGCGNIGAGYDLNNEHVLTHVKGFSMNPAFKVAVYDTNTELAQKIALQYNGELTTALDAELIRKFDCVSICTPTSTHAAYLSLCMRSGVKTILCEKPVSNDPAELDELLVQYSNSNSKILVNYIRRFQPAYHELRNEVAGILEKENLTNIAIRYQRGFINNCSHAFDIIEFLTGITFSLEGIKKHHAVNDHFEKDPTLSLLADAGVVNVSITGLAHVAFSHFEVDLYFNHHKILLSDAGQRAEVLYAEPTSGPFKPLRVIRTFTDALKNYMIPVIAEGQALTEGRSTMDNFTRSVMLNKRMLTYLHQ